ncbi:hypothetical protein PG997_007866 [Apiospora hydei]|uniref:Uncharacterized protein n=1 Tax=Apiospora hydei TaxID=1337664 RepID=A0ABR1W991_9PEZI
MLVLYECSQKRPVTSSGLPRELSYWAGPLTSVRLYDDHVSQWCQSGVDTRQVWELFVDPSGSKGITLVSAKQRRYANSPAYIILYRAMNLEEVHSQYLMLREKHGGAYNIMRQWVQNHGRLDGDDGSVAQLIECVLYWSQSHAWDDLDGPTRPNVPPTLISTHLNAWIIANIVRQRWLGIESILASKQHSSSSEPGMPARRNPIFGDPSHLYADRSIGTIIALWEDLTDNLICRLNAIADIAGLAPSLFEAELPAAESASQRGFLDESFRQVTCRLEEFYRPAKSCHNRTDSSRERATKDKAFTIGHPFTVECQQ